MFNLRALFRKTRAEQEMDDEMRFHLEKQTEQNARQGMSPEEARRAAFRQFGNVGALKEDCRDIWGARFIHELAQDFRYGLRQLRRNPGFTLVAVLTLALGIGANTAVFSVVDAVMLRMLPVEKPQELFQLQYSVPDSGGSSTTFSNPIWEQVRDKQDIFSDVFAWGNDQFYLARGGVAHLANVLWVSGDFFRALGLRPASGRLINSSDDRRGCPAVAVLSYGFWQDHYGGAKGVIGSTLTLSNYPVDVIGVAPAGFFGMEVGKRFDVALPICATSVFDGNDSRLANNSFLFLNLAGRISPKTRTSQLNARLKSLSPRIFAATFGKDSSPADQKFYRKISLTAVPAAIGISSLRSQFRKSLEILMAVVGLVLLIACANLASLMTARAAARHKEVAVRLALGAGRRRLVRQLVTESLLLSSIGALLGVLFARWGVALLVRAVSTAQSAVFLDLSPDTRILGFILAVTVLTALLFGSLPAVWATRVSLTSAMKGSQSPEVGRWLPFSGRKLLTGSQVAFSLVVLFVAGLLLRSFVKLATVNTGFDSRNVLLVVVNLKAAGVPADRQAATYEEIGSRLRALPGVISVGRSAFTPISGVETGSNNIQTEWTNWSRFGVRLPGWPPDLSRYWVSWNVISQGYLPTLRTPLLAGRNFTRAEMRSSQAVAIINQTFARRFFPSLNPIGKIFRMGYPAKPFEVVGLMEDSKDYSLREEAHAAVVLPLTRVPTGMEMIMGRQTFELRTEISPLALVTSVEAAVGGVSKEIPLEVHTLAEQVNDSLVQERLIALLSAFFGMLAVGLAMIGLYGTLSYFTTQRQIEFGIRMALGAGKRDVLKMVIEQGLKLTLIGAGVGIVGALAFTRLLSSLLYGVTPTDPLTFIAVSLILVAVALVACYIPARRAAKVDPMVALRYE
jgi:putative ABC transport system permease protein